MANKRHGYLSLVAASLIAMLATVLFADRIPGLFISAIEASPNLGHERAPRAGDFFPRCDAARAAGVAPLYQGEPGYRPQMDGDNDGIACEPDRGR